MVNIYLSKSNQAFIEEINDTRFLLDSLNNVKVLEFLGGAYSSSDLITSDYMVMVLPSPEFIGRGQYTQIKEFIEYHSLNEIYCVINHHVYKLKSFKIKSKTYDYNEFANIEIDELYPNLSDLALEFSSKRINKTKNKMKRSTSSSLKERMFSQFMPVLADDLGITMDGNICVFNDDAEGRTRSNDVYDDEWWNGKYVWTKYFTCIY